MQRVVHKKVVYSVDEFWAVCPRPEVNVLIYDTSGSISKWYKEKSPSHPLLQMMAPTLNLWLNTASCVHKVIGDIWHVFALI